MKYMTFPRTKESTSRDLLNLADFEEHCCLEYLILAQTASKARIASKAKQGAHRLLSYVRKMGPAHISMSWS